MLKDSTDPIGYTEKELDEICKERNISRKAFNKAFGVNTVSVAKDGTLRYYRCDVERALFRLKCKDGVNHIWD